MSKLSKHLSTSPVFSSSTLGFWNPPPYEFTGLMGRTWTLYKYWIVFRVTLIYRMIIWECWKVRIYMVLKRRRKLVKKLKKTELLEIGWNWLKMFLFWIFFINLVFGLVFLHQVWPQCIRVSHRSCFAWVQRRLLLFRAYGPTQLPSASPPLKLTCNSSWNFHESQSSNMGTSYRTLCTN